MTGLLNAWVHNAQLGGGRLQGHGVHDLDLLQEVFPDVDAVAAASDIGVPVRRTEDDELRRVTAKDAYLHYSVLPAADYAEPSN